MSLRARRGLTITVGVVIAFVMMGLGLWQMASFQRSIADIAGERAAQPSVSLSDNIRADGTIEDIYGRRVELVGTVVPDRELLVGTQWPLRVAVPFETTDGRIVPLVLGLTDAPPGDLVIDAGARMDVEGVFTAGDTGAELTPPLDAPEGSKSSLRLQELVQVWPQPMIAGYVTLDAENAKAFGFNPATAELPAARGTGMHQGYALQWWVFAAASVAFSIVVARGLKPGPRDVA